MTVRVCALTTCIVGSLLSAAAIAQPTVPSPTPGDGAAAPVDPGGASVGNSASTSAVYVPPFGMPSSGRDPNSNLPSSSRPSNNTSNASDSFDLGQSNVGDAAVHGNKGSIAITGQSRAAAMYVPEVYVVKRGDTLWDICDHYFENPWQWPKLWSYNPEIRNPNWIYPGDQLRLSRAGGSTSGMPAQGKGLVGQRGPGDRSVNKSGTQGPVSPDTLFLRDEAFIGDPSKDTWGEIIGAREEQMLLSRGNHVYIDVRPGFEPQIGQQITLFEALRKPEPVDGARTPPGEIVRIKGTVKITDFDPKKKIASAEIIEAVDAIERGVKIGDVERKYRVVPPTTSAKTVWAHVLTSVHPHVYMGQNQLVFIDRGSEDGLAIGNRLLVVRRGDSWRKSLVTATRSARDSLRIDSPEHAEVRTTNLRRDDKEFPEEIIAELRVLKVSRYSASAMVAESQKEIVVGDRAVAREGY
jgi:hypothetical protein